MKYILAILLFFFTISSYSQISFKQLIDGVNWQGTEGELLTKYHDNIKQTAHEEWADEKSCSDFTFHNVKLGDFIINEAPIRVELSSKRLYRVNFIVYEDSKDAGLSKKVDTQLVTLFGAPIEKEDDEGLGIISTYHKEWITDIYKVRSNLFIFGGDTYLYTISVEPIVCLPVDYTKAEVSINHFAISVPKIVSFKVDKDGNVFIKKEGGIEVKKKNIKSSNTSRSEVFEFDGGIISYTLNEVVYMQEGFAATYPIKNKQKL